MPRRANTQTQQEAVQENAAVQANTGADMQMEAAITKTQPEKGVLALADVKIGDFMTIRNVRIKEDDYGLTVAMPKTKAGANEQYKDTVFFADRGIKERFDQTVQKAYETFMHQQTDLDEEPEEAEELEQEESGMNTHLRAVFLRLLLTLEHLQIFVHRTRQQPVIRLSRLVNIPVYLPIIVPEVW